MPTSMDRVTHLRFYLPAIVVVLGGTQLMGFVARRINDSTWAQVWMVGFTLVLLVVMIPLYQWADRRVDGFK